MKKWEPLDRKFAGIHIAADNGKAGQVAADVLQSRLRALGYPAQIDYPDAGYGDWNDELQGLRT